MIMNHEDEEHGTIEKDARRLSNRWHKENRKRTGRLCVGVVGSSRLLAFYEPVAARAMKKTRGYPEKVCDSKGEARAWLSELLAEVSATETEDSRA